MRLARICFALPGLAALVWGAVLAVRFALSSTVDGRVFVVWLAGGPVLHDALVAPVVGLLGLVLGRFLPVAWRAPVMVGSAVSGVLVLLAVPALWRTYGPAVNPGLHDRNYSLGLLVFLAVVWLAVVLAGLWRGRRRKAGSTASSTAPAGR